MNQKGIGRPQLRPIAGRLAVVAVVLLIVLLAAPKLSFIEVRALDLMYSARPAREPSRSIEIIDAGEDLSLYEYLRAPGDTSKEGCKIPRRAYAEATRRLSRWGAKVIVFDMMFARECRFEDRELAQAFRQAGNVVVAAVTQTRPDAVSLQDAAEPMASAVWGTGCPVAYEPNETVRSMPIVAFDQDTGRKYLALSLLAYQCFIGDKPTEPRMIEPGWFETSGLTVPVLPGETIFPLGGGASVDEPPAEDSGTSQFEVISGSKPTVIPRPSSWNIFLINWVGPAGTFKPQQLIDVLQMGDEAGRSLFSGKAVIIGRSGWDAKWTAVGNMPGPEIHADALQTLIDGKFIRPVSAWGILSLLAAFSLSTAAGVRRFTGVRSVLAVLVLLAVSAVVSRELLDTWGIWAYPFYCAFGILLTWGMVTVTESDKVANMLTRFIPSFIAKPRTRATNQIRSMEASILFSDIRGFTTTAEQLSPVDMMTILNVYQGAVEDIVYKYGGTIVKTPGDAVLVVFWKNMRGLNHAACALNCGKEILLNVPEMAPVWEAYGVKLEVGVGINTGEIAMGLVGKRHLEPTVIGDPVNVAQRLESLTKTHNCSLILSENVYMNLDDGSHLVFIDEVTVKGRKAPLRIYTSRNCVTSTEKLESAAIEGH